MPWLQVKVAADADSAAAVEEALTDAGAISVTYEDAGTTPILEPDPGTMQLWHHVRMTALFPGDIEPAQVTAALATSAEACGEPTFERLPDQEWERVWLRDWKPIRFGKRLWVAPPGWPVDDPEAVVVRLDPGLAFGTGTHETTALCLEWIEGQARRGQNWLDYGCGSGILAIAALRLGATAAVAVDIDPQALEATNTNAAANAVGDRLQVVEAGCGPTGQFDTVIANILAAPLIELAPKLAQRQQPGGRIALAGLLREQATAVGDAYAPWYRIDLAAERGDWSLLEGVRR